MSVSKSNGRCQYSFRDPSMSFPSPTLPPPLLSPPCRPPPSHPTAVAPDAPPPSIAASEVHAPDARVVGGGQRTERCLFFSGGEGRDQSNLWLGIPVPVPSLLFLFQIHFHVLCTFFFSHLSFWPCHLVVFTPPFCDFSVTRLTPLKIPSPWLKSLHASSV